MLAVECVVLASVAPAQSGASTGSSNNSNIASWQEAKTPGVEPSRQRKNSGGYLGVYLGDVNGERGGAVVGKVEEGSPGQKAGLQENDVILSFNEQRIFNRTQLHRLLESAVPGSAVTLGIIREGKPQTLSVLVGERRRASADEKERLFSEVDAMMALADDRHAQAEELKARGDEAGAARVFEEEKNLRKEAAERRASVEKELREGKIQATGPVPRPDSKLNLARYNLGLTAVELSKQLASFFNVSGSGVLVTEVRAGDLAERAGIRAGDCITTINGERIGAPADLTRIRVGSDDKDLSELVVTLIRDRNEQVVRIKLDPR